jgi:hypothetical protein
MATNTYVALDKVTVGTATGTVTFSSIPQTYTDLVIVMNTVGTSAGGDVQAQFNSDTTANYSSTILYGTGSAAGSVRLAGSTSIYLDYYAELDTSVSNRIVTIQNYANTTTYKTVLSRANNASRGTDGIVGTWRKTPEAITSVTLKLSNANTFATGSTFSLYGIVAASVGAKATGGTIYSDDLYYYHVFGSTGTFTPLQSISADVLVVAGGGGGGCNRAGGGGAGGLLAYTSQSLTATGYSITVGAGGAGSSSTSAKGTSGSNSQFAALTASVGGGGGGSQTSQTGATGGSGGGGGYDNSAGGSATSGQGFAGGSGGTDSATWRSGGGGGGASAVGTAGTAGGGGTGQGGAGGAGSNTYSSWLSATGFGVSGFIAGGGGGGSGTSPATAALGGSGGGGNGAVYDGAASVAGTIYTGSGGGGGGFNTTPNGASGGSGLVIVRYAK